MGITRVANVTGLDRIGIPVVTVCRPNARSLAVSQGKGVDLDAATVSGLMEAAELYHAEHVELPLKLGSQAELQSSHRFVDIDRLPHVAGGRFHRDLVTLWVEGRDLVTDESRWVPYESVHTNFTRPAPQGSGCFDCSSNGLGSGNTREEAICHALCEVIERDATALWNQLPNADRHQTAIDLTAVTDERCLFVLERLTETGFRVFAWDTTNDVEVAACFCLVEDVRNPESHFGIGAGADLAPDIALLKALIEAVQVRTTYISGSRDDLTPAEYGDRHRTSQRRTAERLRAGGTASQIFRGSVKQTDGIEKLRSLLGKLAEAGIEEAVVVDLSKPELALPVVRVIVPGLEGPDDHDGYLPGERARRVSEAAT